MRHQAGIDYARNVAWPQPFRGADANSVIAPFDVMRDNGWRENNTLGTGLFSTQQALNEAGAIKVQWIVTQAPQNQRIVYVKAGNTEQETNARVESVQLAVSQLIPSGPLPQILVTEIEPEALRRMLDVNIVGTALGLKYAFRAMRPGGIAGQGGVVVNVSSVASTIAFPAIAGYSATKAAVDRLTRVAAMESGKLGYGVRVNCVYPGLVPTDMGMKLAGDVVAAGLFATPEEAVGAIIEQTPLGRLGTVSDMADAVVFLCSDASRFITGAGLPVDGGMGM